jgi:hypothetical protein
MFRPSATTNVEGSSLPPSVPRIATCGRARDRRLCPLLEAIEEHGYRGESANE